MCRKQELKQQLEQRPDVAMQVLDEHAAHPPQEGMGPLMRLQSSVDKQLNRLLSSWRVLQSQADTCGHDAAWELKGQELLAATLDSIESVRAILVCVCVWERGGSGCVVKGSVGCCATPHGLCGLSSKLLH